MDLSIFQNKDFFPRHVRDTLSAVSVDFKEKNLQIDISRQEGSNHMKAAVVLLLLYKKISDRSEYVFQLIKRSSKVKQGGDIGCPGGMLQPRQDNMLSAFLKTGMLPALRGRIARRIQNVDDETAKLIRLFLTTALREAWEEIGLNPMNTKFLGALPSSPLNMFARTIFPVVCITRRKFAYKLNPEVDKILEIPLSFFFDGQNYAMLNIKTRSEENKEFFQYQLPCVVIPDERGNEDILWGATFKIIQNFLSIISDSEVPSTYSSRILDKVLTSQYIFPRG
ncbi:MAG: CoA pyrophosphatase [Syntrophaceae bacterium]|nr:CoA pyrophosphatase [Syntrophaceae bacterium]